MLLAEDTNAVSIHGLTAEDVKTTRRALLAIFEDMARDEWLESPLGKAKRKAMASMGLRCRGRPQKFCRISPIRH